MITHIDVRAHGQFVLSVFNFCHCYEPVLNFLLCEGTLIQNTAFVGTALCLTAGRVKSCSRAMRLCK